jgi:hypothetical protein
MVWHFVLHPVYVNLHHVEDLNLNFSSFILQQSIKLKKKFNSLMSKNKYEMY